MQLGTLIGNKLKVFISYSRRDSDAADALVLALEEHGFEVTIDRRDLPFGEKWKAELAHFIRASDTVLWLVSNHSIASKWCNWELDEVKAHNKRLVPVLIADTARDQLPRKLGEIHILPPHGVFSTTRDLDTLVTTLVTDRVWLKAHTRLADRAHEWQQRVRSDALLLRGGALTAAETWKDSGPTSAPAPSQEVLDLILASRRAASRRQRYWIAGSLVVALGAIALAGVAYWQREYAVENERVAKSERDKALITQSRFLANRSVQLSRSHQYLTARLAILEGLPDKTLDPNGRSASSRPYFAAAETSLYLVKTHSAGRFVESRVLNTSENELSNALLAKHGNKVLTIPNDGRPVIWNPTAARPVVKLESQNSKVNGAVLDEMEQRIATAESDGSVRIWDAKTGIQLQLLPPTRIDGIVLRATKVAIHWGQKRLVVFKTALIAADEHSGQVEVWDLKTKTPIARIEGLEDEEPSFGFSPNGDRILIGLPDKLNVLDSKTTTSVHQANLEEPICISTYTLDGSRIITVSKSNELRVLHSETYAALSTTTLKNNEFNWQSAKLSRDGTHLLSLTDSGVLNIWETITGKKLSSIEIPKTEIVDAEFGNNAKRIVTIARDQTVRIWERLNDHVPYQSLELGSLSSEAGTFHTNSDWSRAMLTTDGSVRVWNITNSQLEMRDSWDQKGFEIVNFDRAGAHFLVTSENGDTYVKRIGTNDKGTQLIGHNRKVTHALFGPYNSRLLTVSSDGAIKIWNPKTGTQVAQLDITTPDFQSYTRSYISTWLAFSADGKRILGNFGGVRVWNALKGTDITVPDKLETPRAPRRVWPSPDGRRVITTGNSHNIVQLRDADTGSLVADLNVSGRFGRKLVVRFSPDGRMIATAFNEKVFLWDAASGEKLRSFVGHKGYILDFAFSADSSRLVTAAGENRWSDRDGTIRIWDVASTTELTQLQTKRDGNVSRIGYCRDGKYICANFGAATVIVWKILPTTQALVEWSKSTSARCLTQAQRIELALSPEPPRWCITGPGSEAETDPTKWKPVWPYRKKSWREWLLARDSGGLSPVPEGQQADAK